VAETVGRRSQDLFAECIRCGISEIKLKVERLKWFAEELRRHGLKPGDHARLVQQRGDSAFRFSAIEEKILWGDLADLLHLVYVLSATDDPIRKILAEHHLTGFI